MRRGNLILALSLAAIILGLASCCSKACPVAPVYRYPDNIPKRTTTAADIIRETIAYIETTCYEALYPKAPFNWYLLENPKLGGNTISPEKYTFASENTLVVGNYDSRHLVLDSSRGPSYAVYHFDELYPYDAVVTVEVIGSRDYGNWVDNGMYIGLRQGTHTSFRWYGPYYHKARWVMEYTSKRIRTRGGGSPSLVIAVANGDRFEVEEIRVQVEDTRYLAWEYERDLYWTDGRYVPDRFRNDAYSWDHERQERDRLRWELYESWDRLAEIDYEIRDLRDENQDLMNIIEKLTEPKEQVIPVDPVEPEEPEEPTQPVIKSVPVL